MVSPPSPILTSESRRRQRSNLLALGAVFMVLFSLPLYVVVLKHATSFLNVTPSGDMNITVRTSPNLSGVGVTSGVVTAAGNFGCGDNGPDDCEGATITVVTRGGAPSSATLGTSAFPLKKIPITPDVREMAGSEPGDLVAYLGVVPSGSTTYLGVHVACSSTSPIGVSVALKYGDETLVSSGAITCP